LIDLLKEILVFCHYHVRGEMFSEGEDEGAFLLDFVKKTFGCGSTLILFKLYFLALQVMYINHVLHIIM